MGGWFTSIAVELAGRALGRERPGRTLSHLPGPPQSENASLAMSLIEGFFCVSSRSIHVSA